MPALPEAEGQMSEYPLHLCRKCGFSKSYDHFPKKKKSGNPCSPCRECRTQYHWKYKAEGRVYFSDNRRPEKYQNSKRWCAANRDQRNAQQAVTHAVRIGKLIRPETCSRCGGRGRRIEAHHHAGYERENRLNVEWLCSSCHGKERMKYVQRSMYPSLSPA